MPLTTFSLVATFRLCVDGRDGLQRKPWKGTLRKEYTTWKAFSLPTCAANLMAEREQAEFLQLSVPFFGSTIDSVSCGDSDAVAKVRTELVALNRRIMFVFQRRYSFPTSYLCFGVFDPRFWQHDLPHVEQRFFLLGWKSCRSCCTVTQNHLSFQ